MMANLYFQHHSSSFQHHMIRQKSMLKCWKLFLFFLFQYFLMNGKFKRTAFIWNINFTFFCSIIVFTVPFDQFNAEQIYLKKIILSVSVDDFFL